MTNAEIAKILQGEARALAGRASALYRVRAYRQAANAIAIYPRSLEEVLTREGRPGLESIPGVGRNLAITLQGLLTTGEIRHVTSERAHVEPDRQTTNLPGVGGMTAMRLREEAQIETVDELAESLDAGRPVAGLTPRRLAALRETLRQRAAETAPPANEPSVEDLLMVDSLFRDQGNQPLTWSRGGFRYRIDLDRSALAHRLDRFGDRVRIRFTDGTTENERILETERNGELTGQRVVRGREVECRRLCAVGV